MSDLFPRLYRKSLDGGLSIQNNFSFMLGTNQLDVSMLFEAFRISMYTSTYGEWLPKSTCCKKPNMVIKPWSGFTKTGQQVHVAIIKV
jgi:hypothetical protein